MRQYILLIEGDEQHCRVVPKNKGFSLLMLEAKLCGNTLAEVGIRYSPLRNNYDWTWTIGAHAGGVGLVQMVNVGKLKNGYHTISPGLYCELRNRNNLAVKKKLKIVVDSM